MGFQTVFFVSLWAAGLAATLVPNTDARPRACVSLCECAGLGRGLITGESELLSMSCLQQNLTTIPTTDPSLELIVILDMSDNLITLLSNNTFYNYPNLQEILLSTNEILALEADAFSGLSLLLTVDLSWNFIEFIHPDTFAGNPNLQTLNLAGNPLTELSGNVPIMNAQSLKALDLSSCKLGSLTLEMFTGLHNLKMFNIRNNNLTHFPIEIFKELENLEEVSLGGNLWQCRDCNIVNVFNTLAQRNPESTTLNDVSCVDEDGNESMWDVDAMESNACNDEPIITVFDQDQTFVIHDEMVITEPQRKAEVFGGVWFYLHQNTVYKGLVVAALGSLVVSFAVMCLCVIRRRIDPGNTSLSEPAKVRSRNLMLAYANLSQKRGSTVPLLTTGSCPPSPTDWDSHEGQPPSLYDEFVRTRPVSEHAFSTIDL